MEWADSTTPVCVRTKLARKMAQERVELFLLFFKTLKGQLQEEGVYQYPFVG
ncbi:MAG: hypothetical protein AAB787_00230 [Patescibacteria group bacterium]